MTTTTEPCEHGEHCHRWHHDYDHACCDCGEPGTPCPSDTCRGCRFAIDECECEDDEGNPVRTREAEDAT